MDTSPEAVTESQPPKVREFLVLGEETLLKQSTRSTGGKYAVMDQLLKPGEGPPPHTHTRADGVFYSASGEFDILQGEQTLRATWAVASAKRPNDTRVNSVGNPACSATSEASLLRPSLRLALRLHLTTPSKVAEVVGSLQRCSAADRSSPLPSTPLGRRS